MTYLLCAVLWLLLAGCSINFSLGTSTQQIRPTFLCTDAALEAVKMSRAYEIQMQLAQGENEKTMLKNLSDGFIQQYHDLVQNDKCWRKP